MSKSNQTHDSGSITGSLLVLRDVIYIVLVHAWQGNALPVNDCRPLPVAQRTVPRRDRLSCPFSA